MDQRRKETRTIGDLEVTVYEIPAMRNLKLMARMTRAVGPALAKLAGMASAADSLEDINVAELAPVVTLLMDRLGDDEVQGIVFELLSCVEVVISVEGTPKKYGLGNQGYIDTVFTGRKKQLFSVLKFSLEVNFGDFLEEARTILGSLQTGSPSKSRKTSKIVGSSGGSGSMIS